MGQQVYLYCERGLAPALLAEPFNAVTNLAYFAAAMLLWRLLAQADVSPLRWRALVCLIGLIAAVGVGSFTFHVLATRLAQIGDVVPIGLVLVSCLWCMLRWVFAVSVRQAATAVLMFGAATLVAGGLADVWGCRPNAVVGALQRTALLCLNGGWAYVPALLTLAVAATVARQRSYLAAPSLKLGAIAFAIAFAARCLDLQLCGVGPAVLHGLWHIGTAYAAFAVVGALIAASDNRVSR